MNFHCGNFKVFTFVSVGLDNPKVYFLVLLAEIFVQILADMCCELLPVDIIQRNINIVTFFAQ